MDIVAVILCVFSVGMFFLAGFLLGESRTNVGAFYLVLCAVVFITLSFAIYSKWITGKTLVEYINNEITYDTICMDKNCKILEITIKKN